MEPKGRRGHVPGVLSGGSKAKGKAWKAKSLGVGAGLPGLCQATSYLTSSLMILREGANSPLMKFAEDIKLLGVVNTNEDSKVVQRDPRRDSDSWQRWGGGGGRRQLPSFLES